MLEMLPQDLNQSKGTFSNHCALGNKNRCEPKDNLFPTLSLLSTPNTCQLSGPPFFSLVEKKRLNEMNPQFLSIWLENLGSVWIACRMSYCGC